MKTLLEKRNWTKGNVSAENRKTGRQITLLKIDYPKDEKASLALLLMAGKNAEKLGFKDVEVKTWW